MRLASEVRPESAIYPSWSLPIVDRKLAGKLGESRFQQLLGKLEDTCRINDLAALHQEADGQTLVSLLPAEPDEFLAE